MTSTHAAGERAQLWARCRHLVALACAAAAAGCFNPVCEGRDAFCTGLGPDGGLQQCINLPFADSVCAPVTPVRCSGVACSSGEQCCLTSGTCFAPADAAKACPSPSGSSAATSGGPCASQLDCAASETCLAGGAATCLGVGTCTPRNGCGTCEPVGSARCQVCGCNGVTYESTQQACVAGVRFTRDGACGSPRGQPVGDGGLVAIACGTPDQCPGGQACCGLTGLCYGPAQPWRCELTADGAVLDCASDAECAMPYGDRFCDGAGCGTPGTCRSPASNCGGEVAPVCGCDGVTYTNECWARHASVRVADAGACR